MVEVAIFPLLGGVEEFFFQLVVEVHIGQFPQVPDHFGFRRFPGVVGFIPVVLHELHVCMDAHVPEHEGHEHVVVIPLVVQPQVFVDGVHEGLQEGADDDKALPPVEGDFLQGLSHVAHPVQGIHRQYVVRVLGFREIFPL